MYASRACNLFKPKRTMHSYHQRVVTKIINSLQRQANLEKKKAKPSPIEVMRRRKQGKGMPENATSAEELWEIYNDWPTGPHECCWTAVAMHSQAQSGRACIQIHPYQPSLYKEKQVKQCVLIMEQLFAHFKQSFILHSSPCIPSYTSTSYTVLSDIEESFICNREKQIARCIHFQVLVNIPFPLKLLSSLQW